MDIWDWKYRLFFDDSVKEALNQWKRKLSCDETKVYEDVEDFYLSFYSFGILWDLIVENLDKSDYFIEKAIKNKTMIIKTPKCLIKYYRGKIRDSFGRTKKAERLIGLLNFSENGKEISSEYWNLIRKLFGKTYKNIISHFSAKDFDHTMKTLPKQKIITGNCEEMFHAIYGSISGDPKMQEMFGVSAIQDFGTQIIDGTGYGEWWDREISDTGEDELVLYTNDNQVKSEDYKYTIIHETYPGHGHFYNYVRAENDCMDHGAMGLIEGWATFCEWNTYPSKYVDAIKHNAKVFLWESFNLSLDSFADSIVERNKKKKKPLRKYVNNLIYATQYIGYIESYYLGALWLELLFKDGKHTPKSFLDMLSKTNKGEFFRLWQ